MLQSMENTDTFGFGERLKRARKAQGLTGEQLAIGAGEKGKNASKQSVADWEHGRHYPKADQLRVICKRLCISADYLLFGDKETFTPEVVHAVEVVRELTDEQRLMLFAAIQAPPVPDHEVERRAPITKTLKKSIKNDH